LITQPHYKPIKEILANQTTHEAQLVMRVSIQDSFPEDYNG